MKTNQAELAQRRITSSQVALSLQRTTFVNGKVAEPFVKWVGGKRSILPTIMTRLPDSIRTYHEPFLGGGALFFALSDQIERAVLSDNNFELILAYRVVQKDPEALVSLLKDHADRHSKHGEHYYYAVRAQEPSDAAAIAARFIYLNKTCYNGLFRVNKAGHFNVPAGKQANPNIISEENIMRCHEALKKAIIRVGGFEKVRPSLGDFVYFDPPYHPTADGSFTGYTKENFSEHDQARLRDVAFELTKKKVNLLLSNSDTKFVRELYSSKSFHTSTVMAPRVVNCKAGRRKAVKEILVANYPTD